MISNSINTNSPFLNTPSIIAGVNGIRKNNSLKFDLDKKTILESSAQDVKNRIVSEKPDQNQTIQDYNYRLQQNTPTSKLFDTTKTFNETQKKERINYEKSSDDIIELTETDDYEKVRNSSEGQGYYIVINDRKSDTGKKNKLMNSIDRWRERINTTYQIGIPKKHGTLVNLVI
ncbi:MAG: hypothetical protein NTX65_07295 [Ignavibacteriales bacterium]|nr:hypothetical protein [Ignavibacteriales bacterium]